jgi:hypothetical protein
MYTILTSRPGQYRTEPGPDMTVIETYDYLFYGRARARFAIASLEGEGRVRVIDEADKPVVNLVPTKFLEKFGTVEEARAALTRLARFGSMDIRLEKVEA